MEKAYVGVARFLTALAVDGRVAASTQNQALNALLFLYRVVLEQDLPWLDDVIRAQRRIHLPVVLTRDEVRRVLERLDGPPHLKDVDFAANQIVVRNGKGAKDRVTMLPASAKPGLNTFRHSFGTHLLEDGHDIRTPGAARPPRRQQDDDLHPRPEPWLGGRAEPGGPDVPVMTQPALHRGATQDSEGAAAARIAVLPRDSPS